MMDIIAMIIIVFLAVIGAMALAKALRRRLFADKEESMYLLIPAGAESEDIELKIKRAKTVWECYGTASKKKIIVLDNGMNDFLKEIVQKECEDDENILLLHANELQKLC